MNKTNENEAKIVKLTYRSIYVSCPYCKKVHIHGRLGGGGSRSPHCAPNVKFKEEYWINYDYDRMNKDSDEYYKLIVSKKCMVTKKEEVNFWDARK